MHYKPDGYKESIEVEKVSTIKGKYVVEYKEGCVVVREGVFPEEVEDES